MALSTMTRKMEESTRNQGKDQCTDEVSILAEISANLTVTTLK